MICNSCKAEVAEFYKGQKRCKNCSSKFNKISYELHKTERKPKEGKIHYQQNREYYIQKATLRYIIKKKRLPSWVSKEEISLINEIYNLAKLLTKTTNIKWNVDHIIPLQGEFVSGLHTISNLQVIPAIENLKKSNKLLIE